MFCKDTEREGALAETPARGSRPKVTGKVYKVDSLAGIVDVSQFSQPLIHKIGLTVLQCDGA